jgi:hypothetical protein
MDRAITEQILLAISIISLLSVNLSAVYAQVQTPQTCTVYNSASAYSSDNSMYVTASPSFNTCTNTAGGASGYSASQPSGGGYAASGSFTLCGSSHAFPSSYDWAGGQLKYNTSSSNCEWFMTGNYALNTAHSTSYASKSGAYSEITTYGWSGNCGTFGSGACWATVAASAPYP